MADEFCLKMPDFHVTFRDLLHAANMRHGTLLPFRRKACWGFFRPEKSDDFGRIWTREIGVPKVSTLPLDHRSRHVDLIRNKNRTEAQPDTITVPSYDAKVLPSFTYKSLDKPSIAAVHAINRVHNFPLCVTWNPTSHNSRYVTCM